MKISFSEIKTKNMFSIFMINWDYMFGILSRLWFCLQLIGWFLWEIKIIKAYISMFVIQMWFLLIIFCSKRMKNWEIDMKISLKIHYHIHARFRVDFKLIHLEDCHFLLHKIIQWIYWNEQNELCFNIELSVEVQHVINNSTDV